MGSKSQHGDGTDKPEASQWTPSPYATSNEKIEDRPEGEPDDTFPEGGLRAWLVAAGTACVLFATLGYSNGFGIFQTYYMLHQLKDETPDNISWIGSTQMVVMFMTGCVAGPLFDRYGANVSLAAPSLPLVTPPIPGAAADLRPLDNPPCGSSIPLRRHDD